MLEFAGSNLQNLNANRVNLTLLRAATWRHLFLIKWILVCQPLSSLLCVSPPVCLLQLCLTLLLISLAPSLPPSLCFSGSMSLAVFILLCLYLYLSFMALCLTVSDSIKAGARLSFTFVLIACLNKAESALFSWGQDNYCKLLLGKCCKQLDDQSSSASQISTKCYGHPHCCPALLAELARKH